MIASVQNKWSIEKTGKGVATLKFNVTDTANYEQWVLLKADCHWDNPHCDRELLTRHLDQAVERDAPVCTFGDTLCVMQGKYDKRASKANVRPEHQVNHYLDAIVDDYVAWHEPYAKQIAFISPGNHEAAIKKNHETDLIERIVGGLHTHGSPVVKGGYSGWIRMQFVRNRESIRKCLWYIHGYAGGGQVTKDMIQRNRQQVYVDGADFMLSGHTHDAWHDETVAIYLDRQGQVKRRTIDYIKTATYKEEYVVGEDGWHVASGKPPKPLGGWWLRFYWDGNRGLRHQLIRTEA